MAEISPYDIVGWRAWYTEGRKYDSATTRWEDLPEDGVVCFVLYHRRKGHRRMMSGVTLYWKDGDIYGCDNRADALIPHGFDRRFVKRGKIITDAEFEPTRQEAFATEEAPE